MAVKIAIAKETAEYEKRVAATPETVKKMIALGADVTVESGAGEASSISDQAYQDAGAAIAPSYADAVSGADIVLKVQVAAADLKGVKKNAVLAGLYAPYQNADLLKSAANDGVSAFSMELVPRITRAQAMDVLSSQSNLSGYKAVLDAAEHYNRAFPMMMTAAGTIAPARVFVMGAGVAGLQAIATAKRLGAVVSATDVRPASKEQVESLGGTFVAVQDEEFKAAETAGGYAKEMSAEYKAKQAALIEETIAKQDIVITTALIPGRAAPRLITAKMVESMKPGSVIVDLAVESGGNCELSEPGQVVAKNGVIIVGHKNVPSRLAADASSLYARNLLNLLGLIIDKESKSLAINWDDDVIKGIALTRGGAIVHPNFAAKSSEAA
ncbi:MAG: Re/Si-specific NAD(P)(+) transhydrogenase subunit alpha [Micavibrio aeruginosavorus]|uniref:NAD(P) transhydrogenase subunit alpha part 1 n=1 Tax=Micavibrio aeruginosavorus TaxID=349221 RepID=A0A2W5BTX5_9BACT|nr:MAG: Re/Si-specific NAD(P)(+) transhydrogenase subunit alpha [Micavibrio aeruginosavorus]